MPTKPHLFIMDPMSRINLKMDTSLRLAYALHQQRIECYHTEPHHLSLMSPNQVQARAQKIEFPSDSPESATLLAPETYDAAMFSHAYMRKDPPTDEAYWQTTWVLDKIPPTTKVLNHPTTLRSCNEKLLILDYPSFSAPALVSALPEQVYDFAKRHGGDLIIKPLQLFGGKGVFRLTLKGLTKAEALSELTPHFPSHAPAKIIQPFDPAIFQGEVRVFSSYGEPLAWCLKKPAPGSFLANTGHGATLFDYEPPPDVMAMVTEISQDLTVRGAPLIGFDIIGGKISEINITSPRLLATNLSSYHFEKLADSILAH